jgi:hypothetical protein
MYRSTRQQTVEQKRTWIEFKGAWLTSCAVDVKEAVSIHSFAVRAHTEGSGIENNVSMTNV